MSTNTGAPKLEYWLKADNANGQPTEVTIKRGFTYKNTGISGNGGTFKFEVTQDTPTVNTVDDLTSLFNKATIGRGGRRRRRTNKRRRTFRRKRSTKRRRR